MKLVAGREGEWSWSWPTLFGPNPAKRDKPWLAAIRPNQLGVLLVLKPSKHRLPLFYVPSITGARRIEHGLPGSRDIHIVLRVANVA